MNSYSSGILYEENAVQYLHNLGYNILNRRYKTKYGEIDIVAEYDNVVVFVEIKFRKQISDGLYCISERQKQRIYNAAEIFIAEHENFAQKDFRFDAIIYDGLMRCVHIENAFD